MRWAKLLAPGAALLAAPLLAQSPVANISPPAEKFATSPGGVDMRSGRYVYSEGDLAIGGAEGLSLTRTLAQPVLGHHNPFANFSHDWDILISEKRINIGGNEFRHSPGFPDYQIEIAFGGLSQTFRSVGTWSFEQISRSGYAILSHTGERAGAAVYTLETGDGTRAVFRPITSNDCSATLRCAYVAQITRADGTVLSFDYDSLGAANSSRLRRVTSNRGYALLLDYSSGSTMIEKACLLNLTVTALPSGFGCPTTGAQASSAYSYTAFVDGDPATPDARLASATDPGGATSGFSYGGSGSYPTMSFYRPGPTGPETTPWLTNTMQSWGDDDGLSWGVVNSQSFADGSSYSYAFANAPPVPGHALQIAGGSFTDALNQTTTLEYDFPIKPYNMQAGRGDVPAGIPGEPPSPMVQQTTPGPRYVTDPLGRLTTYDYCDPYWIANPPPGIIHNCVLMPMAVSVTDPEGIRTEMTWDLALRTITETRQFARPDSTQPNGQPWPPLFRRATYACSPTNFRFCTSPVTMTDARGAVTNYEYDPAHGGLIRETGPAPAAGAARPETRHSYALRQARVLNGDPAGPQVYVRTATSMCRTSAASPTGAYAPCSAANDEVLTQYDHGPATGPNNLQLRGQTVTSTDIVGGSPVTTTLRTCYSYDALGRRISETQPNANFASCP